MTVSRPAARPIAALRITTIVAALALAGLALPGAPAAQNLPAQIKALQGGRWVGRECCGWTFAWFQKSGPFFRGS